MRRFPLTVVAALAFAPALALGCAADANADQAADVRFGRRGEATIFEKICRYTFEEIPPTFTMLELTIENGGLTSFDGRQGFLFVPARSDECPDLTALGASTPEVVSHGDAAARFGRTSGALRPSGPEQTSIVLYQPSGAPVGDFLQLMLDVGALVMNDMLPVTHFAAMGAAICLEGPDAAAIRDRISEAELTEPESVIVTIGSGLCRTATREITGRPWPEVVASAS
ncbi:hypothetical protein GCM10009422_06970 [Brevundimonas kwangchunensis]|uniref:Lipoprotein n=1 Tax=Brevundimonas kwangchunensis TaxID=322163 RepID=A0ABN1GMG9_9CAUL